MSNLQVGSHAHTTVEHTDICGQPKTEIHGRVIGRSNGKYQLEVPYLGVFEVSPYKLKGENNDG